MTLEDVAKVFNERWQNPPAGIWAEASDPFHLQVYAIDGKSIVEEVVYVHRTPVRMRNKAAVPGPGTAYYKEARHTLPVRLLEGRDEAETVVVWAVQIEDMIAQM